MPSLTRRRLLRAGAAVSISSLAGCFAITGDDTDEGEDLLQIGEIEYANFDQLSHTLEVAVSISGDVKYWNTLELASVEKSGSEHTNGTLDIALPSNPVEYTVIARVDQKRTSQTSSQAGIQWSTESIPDKKPRCAQVEVKITDSADIEVENWEAEQSLCDG